MFGYEFKTKAWICLCLIKKNGKHPKLGYKKVSGNSISLKDASNKI